MGTKQTFKGKIFTCIKLGSKLYWNNGVKLVQPSPVQTRQTAPVLTPQPSAPATPVKRCDFDSPIPTALSNILVTWKGIELVISYDWDFKNPNFNCPVTHIQLFLESKGGSKRESSPGKPGATVNEKFELTPNVSSQVLTVTEELNRSIMGVLVSDIVKVCLRAKDRFDNKSDYVCAAQVPDFKLDLPAPVISISPANNGYTVTYTTPTSEMFDAIQIVEYVSSDSSAPIGVNYSATFWGRDNPANVIVQNTNSRWVKARFSSKVGIWTDFSTAVFVKPIDPIRVG